MDYLIRDIDKELWKQARIKAIQQDLGMPAVMRKLIEAWVEGKITFAPADRGAKKTGRKERG